MEYVSEEEYARLQAASAHAAERAKPVERARYDATGDSVILTFPSGVGLIIPVSKISELVGVEKSLLENLQLSVSGEALILEDADVHISSRGLIRDMISAIPAEILAAFFASRGGSQRSAAKRASSAANGRMGGRPRKVAPALGR